MNPFQAFFEKYLAKHKITTLPSNDSIDPSVSDIFSNLLENPKTDHRSITQMLSDKLAIPWLDLDDFELNKIPLNVISEALLRKYPILPLWQSQKRLYIGLANPFQHLAVKAIGFYTQCSIRLILVEQPKLDLFRKHLFNSPTLSLQALSQNKNIPSIEVTTQSALSSDSTEDAPFIRYVNQLLQNAVHKHASDIHFEPQEKSLTIRFRIDGILYVQSAPPSDLSDRILSRIKIMAQLDIAERRLPQDGRFSFTASGFSKSIDCRVSTCPTLQGEKISVRLLDTQDTTFDIQTLGLNVQQYTLFVEALNKSQGMILVTGPTGSGKTLTLYSGLNYLNQTTVNISTVEDPIEICLPGINQINIHPKIGLDFADILKVLLRQDPDVLMVGEMRDTKTAQIGIQAAQTGHLVLSTLHTNSAIETLTRLMNMGIPTYNITSSISLIVAQRLVRRLCPECKTPDLLSREKLAQRGILIKKNLSTFKAHGCKHCTQGYRGRIGVFEVLPMTPSLAASILQGKTTAELSQQAQKEENMITLIASAFEKLKDGIIDITEMDHIY